MTTDKRLTNLRFKRAAKATAVAAAAATSGHANVTLAGLVSEADKTWIPLSKYTWALIIVGGDWHR